MDPRIASLATIAELNGRLYVNCCDGITDPQTDSRLSSRTSSFLHVACHLLDARAYLVTLAGGTMDHPLLRELRSVERVEDLPTPPRLETLLSVWNALTRELLVVLPLMTPSGLDRESSDRMPVNDRSVLGQLAFLIQHESYHLGQLGMMKKELTGKAMRYSTRGPA
jgi:uncharacterized damage-inducible protein DinB